MSSDHAEFSGIRRVRLFLRDYFRELRHAHGMAWSMARMDDCLRSGGHYWGDWGPGAFFHNDSMPGDERVCSQCGTSEWRSPPEDDPSSQRRST